MPVELSDAQAEDIAKRIAAHLPQHAACRVFDDEQILFVKSLCNMMKRTRAVALTSLVGFLVIAGISLLLSGLMFKLGSLLKPIILRTP